MPTMRKAIPLAALMAAGLLAGDSWPGFRGDGSSLTPARGLPVAWSDQSNVAWSVGIEGYGQSSPVILGGTVYVTSTVGSRKETLVTAAYRLSDGELAWMDRRPSSAPADAHERLSNAAPTPVVDKHGVYAFFESGDLIGLDHEGKQRWARFLPRSDEDWSGRHGLGGSPVLSGDRLFLHVAPFGGGRVYAIANEDGRDVWVRDLPPAPSFSTPVIIQHERRSLLLTTGGGGVAACDMNDGEEVSDRRRPRVDREFRRRALRTGPEDWAASVHEKASVGVLGDWHIGWGAALLLRSRRNGRGPVPVQWRNGRDEPAQHRWAGLRRGSRGGVVRSPDGESAGANRKQTVARLRHPSLHEWRRQRWLPLLLTECASYSVPVRELGWPGAIIPQPPQR